jgi:hypothetical protein
MRWRLNASPLATLTTISLDENEADIAADDEDVVKARCKNNSVRV